MAKKKTRFVRNENSKSWNGWEGEGSWRLNTVIGNDNNVGRFVKKNKKALLALPKEDKIALIKRNVSTKWAKEEIRRVNASNVKASELNLILKDYH